MIRWIYTRIIRKILLSWLVFTSAMSIDDCYKEIVKALEKTAEDVLASLIERSLYININVGKNGRGNVLWVEMITSVINYV